MTIQVITSKFVETPICSPGEFLDEALDMMVHSKNSAVLVVEPNNDLVGILTEDDVIRAVQSRCEHGDSIVRDHVYEWMTLDPVTADISTSLDQALTIMTKHQIRHLIVTEAGRLKGVIGVSDVLTALHEKKEGTVQELRGLIGAPISQLSPTIYQ